MSEIDPLRREIDNLEIDIALFEAGFAALDPIVERDTPAAIVAASKILLHADNKRASIASEAESYLTYHREVVRVGEDVPNGELYTNGISLYDQVTLQFDLDRFTSSSPLELLADSSPDLSMAQLNKVTKLSIGPRVKFDFGLMIQFINEKNKISVDSSWDHTEG